MRDVFSAADLSAINEGRIEAFRVPTVEYLPSFDEQRWLAYVSASGKGPQQLIGPVTRNVFDVDRNQLLGSGPIPENRYTGDEFALVADMPLKGMSALIGVTESAEAAKWTAARVMLAPGEFVDRYRAELEADRGYSPLSFDDKRFLRERSLETGIVIRVGRLADEIDAWPELARWEGLASVKAEIQSAVHLGGWSQSAGEVEAEGAKHRQFAFHMTSGDYLNARKTPPSMDGYYVAVTDPAYGAGYAGYGAMGAIGIGLDERKAEALLSIVNADPDSFVKEGRRGRLFVQSSKGQLGVMDECPLRSSGDYAMQKMSPHLVDFNRVHIAQRVASQAASQALLDMQRQGMRAAGRGR